MSSNSVIVFSGNSPVPCSTTVKVTVFYKVINVQTRKTVPSRQFYPYV